MTKKIQFNKRNIESLALPERGKRNVYYDESQLNLMLRVSSNGQKSFYVRRKINGISQRFFIGTFPHVSVEQARKEAAAVMGEIASGRTPRGELRKEKNDPTIGSLFERYMNDYASVRCVRAKEMRQDFRRYLQDWADRRFGEFTRNDVQLRVNKVRQDHGPGAANHMIILMRAAINWNLRNETIRGENPWAMIRQYKIQQRERFLKPDELARIMAVLKNTDDHTIRDYVLMSLYTGARRANVLSMRWDQIDFQFETWRIPLTKNQESHLVPLTSAALQLLRNRKAESSSDWVFPGKDPKKHVVEPKKGWYRILEEAQIEDLRLHDLRRTLASYMAMQNQSLQIIAKVLGHKSIAATQIYSRLTSDSVRHAMEQAQVQMRLI